MAEYFIIDGVKSSDFGIYMINNRVYNKSWIPQNKIYTESLPLQVGERYIDSQHGKKTIDIRCYVESTHESNFNTFSKILAKNNQVKLTLSTELHKEYTVVLENEVEPDLFINGATFNLRYISHYPYAKSRFSTGDIINNGLVYNLNYYYNSDLLYNVNNDIEYSFPNITTTTNIDIHNGSNVKGAKPNIIINGSADDITIKRFNSADRINEINQVSYGAFSGVLEINCLLLDVFLDGSLNNSTFDGRYFELDAGDVEHIYSEDDCIIDGQNIVLSTSASNIDDYYNGYYISLIKKNGMRVFYKIIDYEGVSKIAYTNSLIDAKDGECAIYDIEDGFNYFTIEGTNMNISELKFDFKFLYV